MSVVERDRVPDAEYVDDTEEDVDCDAALVALKVAPALPTPDDREGVAHDDVAGEREGDAGAENVGVDPGEAEATTLLDAQCEVRPDAVVHTLGDAERLLEFVASAGVLEGCAVQVVDALVDSVVETDPVDVAALVIVTTTLWERAALWDSVCRAEREPSRERDDKSDADTLPDAVDSMDSVPVGRPVELTAPLAVGGARVNERGGDAVTLTAVLADCVAAFVSEDEIDADAQVDAVAVEDALPF